ncbi:hypothetical protein [Peterkaempfera sp. SMS 1(5)a]|uniref:hypothetical protein n=1 Tax=Peterkaempfera podocarpi TaxID=3232308 RepID=UPI003670A040
MNEAMAAFGATGTLGPLRCCAALSDIAAVLGPPMDGGRVSKRHRWPHWFLYESVELVVCRCRLVERIGVPTWHNDCRIPGPQPGAWLSELRGMTYQRLTTALDATDCPWQLTYQTDDQITVSTDPGDAMVAFTFITRETYDGPELPEPVLYKAHAWRRDHMCPPIPPNQPDDGIGLQPRYTTTSLVRGPGPRTTSGLAGP